MSTAAAEIPYAECTACGCADLRLLDRVHSGGDEFARMRCDHCGKIHFVRIPPAAELAKPAAYNPLRCPKCRSKHVRVTSTRGNLRHHKCKICDHTFKSVESAD